MTELLGISDKNGQHFRSRFVIATVVLITALGIIVLAWPRLIASVVESPYEETLLDVFGPKVPPEPVIHRLLLAKEQAASLHTTPKTLGDIGLLLLREAIQAGPSSPAGKEYLSASVKAHQAALTFNPRNAYIWTRLSQDLLLQDETGLRSFGPILETAVITAPYDSRLVLARVDIGLAVWEQLSDHERMVINDQIHIAASQSPTALVNITRQRFALTRVVDLLSDNPILLKRYVYAYAHT